MLRRLRLYANVNTRVKALRFRILPNEGAPRVGMTLV